MPAVVAVRRLSDAMMAVHALADVLVGFAAEQEKVIAGKLADRAVREVWRASRLVGPEDGRVFGAAEDQNLDVELRFVGVAIRFDHLNIGTQHRQQQFQQFRLTRERRPGCRRNRFCTAARNSASGNRLSGERVGSSCPEDGAGDDQQFGLP